MNDRLRALLQDGSVQGSVFRIDGDLAYVATTRGTVTASYSKTLVVGDQVIIREGAIISKVTDALTLPVFQL